VHFYETDVEWSGEKKGEVRAAGLPALTVAIPPEFQGHEGIWAPEHFFVAAVNACLMTTFLVIAELSKLNFVAFRSQAQGKLEKVEGQGFQFTEIVLRPHLTIVQERDRERAVRILEKAEKNCFISNSIKSQVRLEPEVSVQQAA
jgi:peroxiredoxin-like protein